ncbi:MAG: hypothetical protein JXN60_00810 [Lentisphaerae bacterium]|nr:hypothetical protein [Lentisphaerota bacterium]
MGWNVLYLRPRTEKRIAEHCDVLGMKYYLPLRKETKIYQRRKVTVFKPIFPGYFFVALDEQSRDYLLRTRNVHRILEPSSQRFLLHQLSQIRRALRIDPTLGSCAALQKGRRVRIKAGPFMGIEGVIWALKKQSKVRLNVEMIGQAIAVDVDQDYLEVID